MVLGVGIRRFGASARVEDGGQLVGFSGIGFEKFD